MEQCFIICWSSDLTLLPNGGWIHISPLDLTLESLLSWQTSVMRSSAVPLHCAGRRSAKRKTAAARKRAAPSPSPDPPEEPPSSLPDPTAAAVQLPAASTAEPAAAAAEDTAVADAPHAPLGGTVLQGPDAVGQEAAAASGAEAQVPQMANGVASAQLLLQLAAQGLLPTLPFLASMAANGNMPQMR